MAIPNLQEAEYLQNSDSQLVGCRSLWNYNESLRSNINQINTKSQKCVLFQIDVINKVKIHLKAKVREGKEVIRSNVTLNYKSIL